jgi:hypothetical protein
MTVQATRQVRNSGPATAKGGAIHASIYNDLLINWKFFRKAIKAKEDVGGSCIALGIGLAR